MLTEETLRLLHELNLHGMAESYDAQRHTPDIAHLAFDDRLGYMLHREKDMRDDRRLERLLRLARFRFPSAHIDQILWSQRPGLERAQIYGLREGDWIKRGQFCLITGKTGTGKSWLGCALGQAACKRGYRVRFAGVSALLEQLAAARLDGTYAKLVLRLQQADLVILDDLGTKPLDAPMSSDLLDLLEDRYDRKATLVTSQYPVADWHALFRNPTLADAIMDRLTHHSHRIDLSGDSLRKLKPEKRNPRPDDTTPPAAPLPDRV